MSRITIWPLFITLLLSVSGIALAGVPGKDKGKDDEKLKKIMILLLVKNYENRKLVENEITYYVNDKGFEAEPSIKYLSGTGLPGKEDVITAIKDNGFDGLLLVQVIDLEVKKKWVNAKMKYGNTRPYSVFYSFYDLSLQYTPGYATQEMNFEVESSLFRLEDQEQVFSHISNVYEHESLDLAMESFAMEIANQLKRSKTLLKTK